MSQNKERRFIPTAEIRNEDEGYVTGYGAVFNSLSPKYTYFREQIAPGAFDEVDQSDVVVTFNHNFDNLLARTSNGSATLEIDDRGLKYRYKTPNTTTGRDVEELIRSQTLAGSSFMFTVDSEEWAKDENDEWVRTITKVGRLYELGPVATPWYPDTDAQLKTMRAAGIDVNAEDPEEDDKAKPYDPSLDLLKLKSKKS